MNEQTARLVVKELIEKDYLVKELNTSIVYSNNLRVKLTTQQEIITNLENQVINVLNTNSLYKDQINNYKKLNEILTSSLEEQNKKYKLHKTVSYGVGGLLTFLLILK